MKGVLAPDDAVLAVDHGAAAVIVSNHGGRQLDARAGADHDAARRRRRGRAAAREVLVDGGVRRGTDVLKALALGARAVLVGRPVLWGLTLDGADGVRAVLQHIRARARSGDGAGRLRERRAGRLGAHLHTTTLTRTLIGVSAWQN